MPEVVFKNLNNEIYIMIIVSCCISNLYNFDILFYRIIEVEGILCNGKIFPGQNGYGNRKFLRIMRVLILKGGNSIKLPSKIR